MRGAIAWFARNHVAANLLMMLLIAGGLWSIPNVPQKVFPDIDTQRISIAVTYLGAAPEEVEQSVCVRIEEEIQGINGIEKITSSAAEGACGVTAELIEGTPVDRALSEVKNAVDGISTFPEQTEKPIITYIEIVRTAVALALSGDASERALKEWGERLRDELSALPGITQVRIQGARDYEISIEVPEQSLRRHGLTFEDVASAVRRSSLDLPGGSIKTLGGEILLRTKGQAYTGSEFEELVVLTREDGTRLHLRDVANVVDGFDDEKRYSRFDGHPTVLILVDRVGDQRVLELVGTVKDYLPQIESRLPDGLTLTVWDDGSQTLRDRLGILVRNGRSGFVLVFILLALFLKLRLAFWVALGVPISFLGALSLLPVMDISIDVISLFAFIMVLGLLVDDAIVIGENVHTHQEASEEPLEAAIAGTQEVAVPVVFGVLTTVAAFMPMVLAPGQIGQIWGEIGLVVILCLVFSLIESQLILPAHLGHHVGHANRDAERGATGVRATWKRVQSYFGGLLARIAYQRYQPLLERALEWRLAVLAGGVVVLMLALTFVQAGYIKFRFFPEIESDTVTASVTMPQGTPVETTAAIVDQLESAARELAAALAQEFPGKEPVVKHILASYGEQGGANTGVGPPNLGGPPGASHLGEVKIELQSGDFRPVSARVIERRWKEGMPPVPDVEELTFRSDLFSSGAAIDVELRAPDVEQIQHAANRLKERLADYPGTVDITDSFLDGKQEIKLSILPGAEALGLTLEDLARQVRQAFYGEEAQRVQRGRDDIRVMVRYPEEQRRSLADLDDLRIRTPAGGEVPFYAVARAEPGRGYSTIKRADRQRVINVSADVDPREGNPNEIMQSLAREVLPQLVAEHPGLSWDVEGEQREQGEAFGALGRTFLLALLLIYTLLAIPLRSYTQPLLIMAVIPFGFVGALVGHALMGGFGGRLPDFMIVARAATVLSMMSIFGVVAVSGVVVNASLVLVHTINERLARGRSLRDAVIDAGTSRFRPIVLTSMTTFAGLSPVLIEQSVSAQFVIPMAISLAWGALLCSGASLFLVPCSYVLLEDLRGALAGRRETLRQGPRQPGPAVLPPAHDPAAATGSDLRVVRDAER